MNNFVRYFMAIIMIGIGIILVLSNLNVIDSSFEDAWHYIYPGIFIVIGFVLVIGHLKDGKHGWMFGSFLVLFGSLLLLGEANILDFTFEDIFVLWPLLIIYAGLLLMRRHRQPQKYYKKQSKKGAKENTYFHNDISVGTFEYNDSGWKVEPIEMKRVVGDFYFDFTKAAIPEEEIPISINSWAGNIEMILPENLPFRVEADVKAGEIRVLRDKVDGINRQMTFETPAYEESKQKLDIKIYLKAGSLTIDQVIEEKDNPEDKNTR